MKGIRTAIKKFERAAASCDELANMMPTPWSDLNNGVHYLSRSKMNTFTQCEPDSVITGSGAEHVVSYAMQFKAFGQVEVVAWVASPDLSGL